MAEIEKALRDSDLGVNPTNDGTVIRWCCRSSPRSAARTTSSSPGTRARTPDLDPQHPPQGQGELDQLVKDGEVGEDEGNRAEKELEATTKKYVDTVDDLLKHKESELLEV